MRAMNVIAAVATILAIGAPGSQPPSPAKAELRQPVQKKPAASNQQAAPDIRGTEKMPLIVKSIGPETSPGDAKRERDERNEKSANERGLTTYTGWLVIATVLLVIVGAAQAGLFVWQLRLIKSGTGDAKALALAAQNSAEAAKTQADALRLAQRAYVKLSHIAPGIRWSNISKETFMVDVKILNYGRTPTNVTDVVLCATILPDEESLPPTPTYNVRNNREEIPSGFLMPGDYFTHTGNFTAHGKLDAVINKESKIWIIGYVDYIDVFKQRHRGGYARVYNRWLDDGKQNNLTLVTQQGYNYDRQREKGEGNDWN